MLQNCIDIFLKSPDMDKLIIDTYIPADGTYLLLRESQDGFNKIELLDIKLDKKNSKLNITEEEKIRISYYDYYSKLVDMNKPIDIKKIIQSNNYLSFWIKKESLSNGKLTVERIEYYYDILSDPYKKYKNQKDKELYTLVAEKVGAINQEKLEKIKNWVINNVFNLPFELIGKDYLKIFFICDGTSFEKEGYRYILPNIYNKNDYNVKHGDEILGLPNENMGLNSKKPYLENKSRKITVPTLANTNQILYRKKFFDYLWNLTSLGQNNIYYDINKNRIYPFDLKTSPNSNFNGYFMRIKKDKNEAAIIDMDMITSYKPELEKSIVIENVVNMDTNKLREHHYGRITKLYEIKDVFNNVFFSRFLIPNLFTDPDKISIKDSILKESILIARNSLFNWFYKGYEYGIESTIDRITLNLIKNSITKSYFDKAQHQFNARVAFLEYFKGGKRKMADVMKEIRDDLRNKINSKYYDSIGTDQEYYYAVGQLIRFFISLNKSSKKNHSLFNPFLNIKSDNLLKEKLGSFFKKYNYTIEENTFRFNNLYKLIVSYKPDTQINQDFMIAGYISNSLIYEKKEEK